MYREMWYLKVVIKQVFRKKCMFGWPDQLESYRPSDKGIHFMLIESQQYEGMSTNTFCPG